MEYKGLYAFTLIIIAVSFLLGVGVLALDKFSLASYQITTTTNESHAWNQGSIIQLTHYPLETISSVQNNSGSVVTASNYTIIDSANGLLSVLDNVTISDGDNAKITYTWDDGGATQTAVQAAEAEVSGIATNWLGLIVTIAILAIVIGLVITGFAGSRGL